MNEQRPARISVPVHLKLSSIATALIVGATASPVSFAQNEAPNLGTTRQAENDQIRCSRKIDR